MGSSYSFGGSPTFRYRPHVYRSSMPCFRIGGLLSTVSFPQIAHRGPTTTVVGASSATQDVGSTSGWAANDYLVFSNGSTWAIRQVDSVTDADTVVLKTTIDTTSGTWTVREVGASQYAFGSMIYVDEPMPVKGVIAPTSTNFTSGDTLDLNLSIFSTTVSGSDWTPNAIVNANAWGTKQIVNTSSGNRAWGCAFQSTCWIDIGYYFILGIPRPTAGGTTNAGTLETLSILRGEAQYDTAAFANPGRYDIETTAAIAYLATTPAAAFAGATWSDAGGLTTNRPQNINWALWLDRA